MSMINKVYIEYLLLKDEPKSFELVLNIIYPKLLAFAQGYLKDKDMAQDVVQEAMLAISKGVKKLKNHRRFHAWIYQITRNKCLDLIRKNQKYKNNIVLDEVVELQATTKNQDEELDMMSVIKQLPSRHKNIIHLFYYAGFSILEIAEILNKPAGTIKSLLFDARAKIKQLFGE